LAPRPGIHVVDEGRFEQVPGQLRQDGPQGIQREEPAGGLVVDPGRRRVSNTGGRIATRAPITDVEPLLRRHGMDVVQPQRPPCTHPKSALPVGDASRGLRCLPEGATDAGTCHALVNASIIRRRSTSNKETSSRLLSPLERPSSSGELGLHLTQEPTLRRVLVEAGLSRKNLAEQASLFKQFGARKRILTCANASVGAGGIEPPTSP
jgi:hypothetical protein